MALPPGPTRPSTLEWFAHPYRFMEECAREFGDAFTFELEGTGRHLMVSHPEAVRQVFTAPAGSLQAGAGNAVWLSFMGPGSLLLLDGEPHLRERRLMAPAFRRLEGMEELIARVAAGVADRWPVGRPFPLLPSMLDLSLEVILRAVFGLADGERLDAIRRSARSLLEASAFGIAATRPVGHEDLGELDPWAAFTRRMEALDELLYAEIAERRREPSGRDLLSRLLQHEDRHVRDELVTLLMAGHETTATSLAWAFHEVLTHPVEASLLEAACQETLRLHPIIPMVSRKVARTLEVAGWRLEPGMNVSAGVWLTHQRPDLYPAPREFRPERFLERRYSPFEYYPFGGGERRCVGAEFALLEMRVALRTILDRVKLERTAKGEVRPVRRNVSMAPSDGTRVTRLE